MGAYLWYIQSKNAKILAYWGFTEFNLKESFQFLAPLAAFSSLSFLIIGLWNQQAIFSWHIIPIIVIYPIWGLIQQFLIVSLFAGNLKHQSSINLSNKLIIPLTAILFGVVHYPFPLLMLGTSILALVYTYTYLRFQNLWYLGIFHGVLGALFYYWF